MSTIAIIGYGNVGYHFANELAKKNEVSVFSRHSNEEGTRFINELEPNLFEYIILCVPDDVIKKISDAIPVSEAVVLHTSGAKPLSDLGKHSKCGVLYPLQTFSKNKMIDFSFFPVFIEGNELTELELFSFARSFCSDVRLMTSEKRAKLHLAAVFACNFSNHILHIAEKYLKELDMNFEMLQPLVEETFEKAIMFNPSRSQTGPAKRGDAITMDDHLKMIKDDDIHAIYRLISDHIQKIK